MNNQKQNITDPVYLFSTNSDGQMKRDREMLDSLFKFATEGIIICDRQGIIWMANPTAERMFGYEKRELREKPIETLLPSRYREKHVGLRTAYAQQPKPRTMGSGRDLYGIRKDGSEIMVEVSLSPFTTSEGDFIMSFIVDITERKKNETDLRIAHERLQQTTEALSLLNTELESKVQERTEELADAIQRLAHSKGEVMRALEKEKELNELKSRFVTTASHEFRTPLGTILSSVSLIARYSAPEDADKRRKHIDRIKSAVSNLTEILNDFLSIEKLEEGIVRNHPETFDLSALVQEIADEMRAHAKAGQEIRTNYSGAKEVVLDPHLLKNALLNLVSNAIKYSPAEKPIDVVVSVLPRDLRIEVRDQGIGIPESDQQHIFERFFRAHNAGNIQGTGLGLNIVKKYVELMNGTVTLNSRQGEGSVFTIRVPVPNTPE